MRLRHIEVFNAIMIAGTVSGAAKLINISQPAVSRLLQNAEVQLGFALFQRSKGRLIPTSEALALHPRIEHLFSSLTDVQRLASSLKAGKADATLTVLSILALSHDVLPRAVKLFQAKHPKVGIRFKAMHSPEILAALALQEADVGLVFSQIGTQPHPALIHEVVESGHLVCVAPKGALRAKHLKEGQLELKDLETMAMIGLDAEGPIGMAIHQACEQHGVSLNSLLTVQTYHAALALVEHGLGSAIVDSFTALSSDLSKVDVVRISPSINISLAALRPATKSNSVIVRAFVKAVQQVCAQASE
jgi:DNA-binding transcriptional LysR family regulator